MSKLLLPLLCICLSVWLFGGAIWFGDHYAASNNTLVAFWTLEDHKNVFKSPTTFTFQDSDSEVILDDNQHQMLAEIAEYLSKHKNRNLYLVGYYTKSEINNSDFENLGKARAESFLYLLYRQGVDLAQLETSGKLLDKHQLNGNGLIHGGVDFTFLESPLVKYGTAFSLSKSIQFEEEHETKILTKDFDAYIASVRQYLIDAPDKTISLTGYSDSIEENELAQKRVLTLKKILTQNGVQGDRISSSLISTDEASNEATIDIVSLNIE